MASVFAYGDCVFLAEVLDPHSLCIRIPIDYKVTQKTHVIFFFPEGYNRCNDLLPQDDERLVVGFFYWA